MVIEVRENAHGDLAIKMPGVGDFYLPAATEISLLPAQPAIADDHEVLVPALRWVSPDRNIFVFERQPGTQTINYTAARRDAIAEGARDALGEAWYTLPLPWTVYVIAINELGQVVSAYLFARTGPLRAHDNPLSFLPLTNLYQDGRICLGDAVAGPTMAGVFASVYTNLWSGSFNDDLSEQIASFNRTKVPAPLAMAVNRNDNDVYCLPAEIYQAWSNFTIEEVITWEYLNSGLTLEALLTNLSGQLRQRRPSRPRWTPASLTAHLYDVLYHKATELNLV